MIKTDKQAIELEMAKKRYELDKLAIQLKYATDPVKRIGFEVKE